VLDVFFHPQSVAVIGASRTPGKPGYGVLRNIVQHGFQGAVYPTNPKADRILGLRCYPNVLRVPGPIDLAVFLIPSRYVAQVLVEGGDKGVKGAVVISAGFREVGTEGGQREREIVKIARRYGMRPVGPNCLGIIDTISRLSASFAVGMRARGPLPSCRSRGRSAPPFWT
jgi:acetyltransferase